MKKFSKDLIEYSGIEPYDKGACSVEHSNNFKQTNIDLEFCVPPQKPDIEQIVKVDVSSKIYKTKLVRSPRGTSLEGQKMTGYKMLILGEVTLKIRYVADESEQSMHTFHASIPFCDYIVLTEEFCSTNALIPQVYVEDIFVNMIDSRCLFSNLNIMLFIEVDC